MSERKFRLGESTNKPRFGNVADQPFACSLVEIARQRGIETQTSLARRIGGEQAKVSEWVRGKAAPNPDIFGRLLIELEPDGELRESFIDAYGELLQKGLGTYGLVKGSEAVLKIARKRRKESNVPFGRWIEDFCDSHRMTMNELFEKLDLETALKNNRDRLGIGSMSEFAIRMQEQYDLTPKQLADLGEAMALTIEQRLAQGHKFLSQPLSARQLYEAQKSLKCRTYNGQQAAHALAITRERVRVLRNRYGLSLILTDADLDQIRQKAGHGSKMK